VSSTQQNIVQRNITCYTEIIASLHTGFTAICIFALVVSSTSSKGGFNRPRPQGLGLFFADFLTTMMDG
jgi:hypothetical protein